MQLLFPSAQGCRCPPEALPAMWHHPPRHEQQPEPPKPLVTQELSCGGDSLSKETKLAEAKCFSKPQICWFTSSHLANRSATALKGTVLKATPLCLIYSEKTAVACTLLASSVTPIISGSLDPVTYHCFPTNLLQLPQKNRWRAPQVSWLKIKPLNSRYSYESLYRLHLVLPLQPTIRSNRQCTKEKRVQQH